MSYLPLPGFYQSETANSQQNYGNAPQQPADNSDVYASQGRTNDGRQQGQYLSSGYDWSSQAQQPVTKQTQSKFSDNNSWRETRAPSYDYPRQNDFYPPSTQAAMSASAYATTPRDSYGTNTQALNNLVYASALKPSDTRSQTVNRNSEQPTQGYTSKSVKSTLTAPRQPQSSVENTRYSVQPPESHPIQQERSDSSTSSHNMAVKAAAALADAVNNRYPAPTQQPLDQRPVPPATISAQVRATTSKVNAVHGTNTLANRTLQTSQHGRPPATSPAVDKQPQPNNPQAQHRNPSQNSAQHTNSIANLVSAANEADYENFKDSQSQEPMPNFVDPSQVFNPYRREHERKKQDAMDAEARQKAEEARQAEEKRKREEIATSREKETTANSKSKITRKSNVQPQNNPAPSKPAPSTIEKEAMAAEMKAFMEKMKEFRSKDPATFSQLWNDMRGKENPSGQSSSTGNSVSPRIFQAALPLGTSASTIPSSPQQQAARLATTVPKPTMTPGVNRTETMNEHLPGVPLNGFKVVVEDNPEDLPDLGKYPAMRRIRGHYSKKDQPNVRDASIPSSSASAQIPPLQHQSMSPAPTHAHSSSQTAAPSAEAWPEPRRRAVAIAAIHLLKAMPENANNPIIARDIAAMLERNPSYNDLCSALELRGLKFLRSTFAKDLLKHVPDLNASTPNQGQSQNADAQAQESHFNPPVGTTPFTTQRKPNSTAIKLDGLAARENHIVIKSSREPLPGTKEAAARKRDFSELVDLTSLSDNEDYVMPKKRQQINGQSIISPDAIQVSRNGIQPVATDFPLPVNSVTPLKFDTKARIPVASSSPNNFTGLMRPPPLLQSEATRPQKNRMVLAKKLDKSEAVQKSYYDPKTVARDVLIASGRHPLERPLNLHLAGMIGQYIDLDSDLSTFDWDAVDPGGPPPRTVEYVEILATKPRLPKNKVHLHRLSLEQAMFDEAALLPKESKRSPTIRESPPASVPDRYDPHVTKSSKSRHSRGEFEGKSTFSISLTPQHRRISIDIRADQTPNNSSRSVSRSIVGSFRKSENMDAGSEVSVKKRVGRPPGAKNKYPSVAGLRKQAASIRIDLPRQPQAQAQTQAQPQSQPDVEEITALPVNPEYKCKWIKCHAVLHNLNTLRRHVEKRHIPDQKEENTVYVCWWKKCPLLKRDDDGGIVPSRAFNDKEEWLAHIEEEHIQPLGAVYGDGPSTTHTDPSRTDLDRERYLSDGNGRETTPAIGLDGSLNLPADALELTRTYPQGPKGEKQKADIRAQDAFMRAHGAKSTDQKRRAIETIRAMTARKEKIGPGIDRGGCTLINEERRSTFIQSPGIARIIDTEY